jgi:putative oxidoreductase
MSASIPIDWTLLLLRAILAAAMIYYGWPKISKLNSNAKDFELMGFAPGIFWGTLIAAVEFLGGIAVLIGFYAELAAAMFGFQMMVGTFWKLKLKKSFTDYSYDLQLFALCLVLMSMGAGIHSLKTLPGWIFLRWDVAVLSLAGSFLLAALSKPHLVDSSRQPAAA